MKLLFLLLLSCSFSNNSFLEKNNSILGKIPLSKNNNSIDIPDDFIDLIYLKLITESIYNNHQPNFKSEYKIFLTETNSSISDTFNIKWVEISNNRNYNSNISWKEGFHKEILLLLNDNWNIQQVLDHLILEDTNQKLYIFKKITKI